MLYFSPPTLRRLTVDHSSWMRAGYRSGFVSETVIDQANPNIHTAKDEIDGVDVTYMAEFVRLGVGMAEELAGEIP